MSNNLLNLKQRLLQFPYVKNDDIVDALSMLILYVFLDKRNSVYLNVFNDENIIKENLLKIVSLMLDQTNAMIADQGLHIAVTEPVKSRLVDLGYNPEMGARPLRRVIQEQIEDRVADYYLDHPEHKQLTARLVEDQIQITDAKDSQVTD